MSTFRDASMPPSTSGSSPTSQPAPASPAMYAAAIPPQSGGSRHGLAAGMVKGGHPTMTEQDRQRLIMQQRLMHMRRGGAR